MRDKTLVALIELAGKLIDLFWISLRNRFTPLFSGGIARTTFVAAIRLPVVYQTLALKMRRLRDRHFMRLLIESGSMCVFGLLFLMCPPMNLTDEPLRLIEPTANSIKSIPIH